MAVVLRPAIAVAEAVSLVEPDQLADIDLTLEKIFRQVDAGDRRRKLAEVLVDTLLPARQSVGATLALHSHADRAALRFAAR
ncbi:hypothetical protein D3C71_1967640 [compost metagenome]